MVKIAQFGLSRTGSTLIHRILQEVLGETIPKCHLPEITEYLEKDYVTCTTVRHPIDSFFSYVRIYNPNYNSFRAASQYIDQRLDEHRRFSKIINSYAKNIIIFKYENFYNNYKYIYSKLEKEIGLSISTSQRRIISRKVGIKSSLKIQNTMSSFYEHDEESGIHGEHIANIEPNSYKKIVDPDLWDQLELEFKDQIEEWEQI